MAVLVLDRLPKAVIPPSLFLLLLDTGLQVLDVVRKARDRRLECVDIFGQQVVRGLVLADEVRVNSAAGEHRAEQETKQSSSESTHRLRCWQRRGVCHPPRGRAKAARGDAAPEQHP